MWKIDPNDAVPVYEQIANQLRYGIARGRYAPGDRLPSVRALARETLVNPNTIVRVYRDLEHEGIVRTEGGRGMFVTEQAPPQCRRATRAIVERRIEVAFDEAERAGVTLDEVEEALARALAGRREVAGRAPADASRPAAAGRVGARAAGARAAGARGGDARGGDA